MKFLAIGFMVLFISANCSAQVNVGKQKDLDAYPTDIAEGIRQQQVSEISAASKSVILQEQFLINKKRWDPGSTVLVAFNGGPPSLHRAIAEVAAQWSKYANIRFDFGYNSSTGKYRSWSESDKTRVAHIRIGFSEAGYWSAVGTDSMRDDPFSPGRASMNFQGFMESWPSLITPRWKTVVLHEFGHALGFRHEHQQQVCFPEIRWERGANGEPDVYDVFLQWQGWGHEVVDVNMRPAQIVELGLWSPLDLKSIMYYASPAQTYRLGEKSICFLKAENTAISAGDAKGAMLAYPKNPTQAIKIAALTEAQMEEVFATANASFSETEKSAVRKRIISQSEARKPLVYIHIQRESDRPIAKEIQLRSRDAGFIAPGIENVSTKGLKSGKTLQVRFFREIDQESAEKEAQLLREVTNGKVDILHVKKYATVVSRNLVEVWLP